MEDNIHVSGRQQHESWINSASPAAAAVTVKAGPLFDGTRAINEHCWLKKRIAALNQSWSEPASHAGTSARQPFVPLREASKQSFQPLAVEEFQKGKKKELTKGRKQELGRPEMILRDGGACGMHRVNAYTCRKHAVDWLGGCSWQVIIQHHPKKTEELHVWRWE